MSVEQETGTRRKLKPNRFRITSIVIAMLFITSSLSVLGNSTKTEATQRAHITTTISPDAFIYQPHTGTFTTNDSPVLSGAIVENIVTSWGKVGFRSNWFGGGSSISQLFWGSTEIVTQSKYFDVFLRYWYYNTTSQYGSPFAGIWSDFYQIRNDSYIGIWEYYAEGKSHFASVNDINATVRFTVWKEQPYIKVDLWLRYLVASGLIANMDITFPRHSSGGTFTGGYDSDRRLSYYSLTSGATYYVGQIGSNNSVDGTGCSQFRMGVNSNNRTENRLDQSWHASSMIVIGSTLGDIQAKAEKANNQWFVHYPVNNYNLVLAYNNQTIDSFAFHPTTGYSYTPRGTYEYLVVSGVKTAIVSQPNPILSYQRIPFIQEMDDINGGYGEDPTWDWIFDTTRMYGIATGFPTQFSSANEERLNYWNNQSNERYGTQYERKDHSYNHTSLLTYSGYDYNYNIWKLSETLWNTNSTSADLISASPAYDEAGYNTWDAYGAGGALNMRYRQVYADFQMPFDYNLTESPIFVADYMRSTAYGPFTQLDDTVRQFGNAFGYLFVLNHDTGVDTAPEKAIQLAFWSWLENNTDTFISVTHAQWSDLWHHRIAYSEIDGYGQIDLSTATVNHYLLLNASPSGSFWWDQTAGTLTSPMKIGPYQMWVPMMAGHIYRELPFQISTTTDLLITPSSYSPILIQWTADPGTGSPIVTFTLSGLENGERYRVYVDGAMIENLIAAGGSITFTYSGPWSERQFEVVTGGYGSGIVHLGIILGIMMGLGLLVSVLVPVVQVAQEKRKFKVDDLIQMVIYIVVSVSLIGLVYALLP